MACEPRGTAASRRGGHGIPRLRRQHRRNQDLERFSCCFLAIFSTAGSSRPSIAFASRRMTGATARGPRVMPCGAVRRVIETGVSGGFARRDGEHVARRRDRPSRCAFRASRCRDAARAATFSSAAAPDGPPARARRHRARRRRSAARSSAHASASSSTTGPRAVLIRNADRFMRASARRSIR